MVDQVINTETLQQKSAIELIFENLSSAESFVESAENAPTYAQLQAQLKLLAKQELRQSIYNYVADLDSLFGTIADASHVLTVMLIIQMEALNKSTSFEEYKSNMIGRVEELFGKVGSFNEYASESTKMITAIAERKVIMPYMVKEDGLMGVIRDVSERATGVAKKILEKLS